MPTTALHPDFRSATSLLAALDRGTIGCREALEHCLARVDRFNPEINAIVVQDRVAARTAADTADAARTAARKAGTQLPPLHGLPISVKESFNVTGMPTTWGVPEARDNIASHTALAVQRLQAAGAVLFGKSNVPIQLGDFQSYNEIYGTTENPWRYGRTPGGSSGGAAAALASGMTMLELGSDIGGSIRNPAHYCGVFGHKPTWNLLPPRGHSLSGALAPTDISVIGPLARSAADLERALTLLAIPDALDSGRRVQLPGLQKPLRDLRIALWRDDAMCPVTAETAGRVDAVASALAKEGAFVDPTARPDFSSAYYYDLYYQVLLSALGARMSDAEYEQLVKLDPALLATLSEDDRDYVGYSTMRQRDWLRANESRTAMCWAWHRFFESFDFVLMPVMPTPAFEHDQRSFSERSYQAGDTRLPYFRQNFWAGIAGVALLPSTVIPTGVGAEGLPIGVQIVGPAYGDRACIQLALQLEGLGFAFEAPPGCP